MSDSSIIMPIYFRVIKRVPGGWRISGGEQEFYNPRNVPLDLENKEQRYGLTREQVTIELFRINGGRLGYYLANLRDRKYYYCGEERVDVKATLLNIGIGQRDPMDEE